MSHFEIAKKEPDHGKARGDKRSESEPESGLAFRSAEAINRLIFFCLLALVVLTAIPYGSVDAWWEAFFECSVFILAGLWLIEVALRGRWEIRKVYVLLPMAIMTAYAFFQTVGLPAWFPRTTTSPIAHSSLSIDPYQTHLTAVKMLALTVFTGLLILHVSSLKRLRWIVRVVIGVALGSTVFGIARQLMQSPDAVQGFVLPFLSPGIGYAQFLSPNVFAFLVEMAFGLVAGLVLGAGLRRQQVLIFLAIGIVIWAGLVLSNSRGALLGFICQAVFLLFVGLAWFSSRRLSRPDGGQRKILAFIHSSVLIRVIVVLVIVGTLVAGVLWMGGQDLASKLNSQDANLAADGTNRNEIWKSTWGIIKHNPWTGVGFGAYFLAITQYQDSSGRTKVEQAHNDYLDLAAGGGIIAVALAAFFIGLVMWRARASLRSPDGYRRAAALGALAGMLSVAIHSFADFGLQVTGIGVVFATLIVIAVADIPVANESPAPSARPPQPRGLTAV